MRHTLEAIWALCLRELLRFTRERSSLYATIARPVLWLIILGSGMQDAFRERTGIPYAAFMLPGVVAMTVLFGGILSGVSTVWDREVGFLKEVLVAPIPRLVIALGKLLAGTLVTTTQALITTCFAPLIGVSFSAQSLVSLLAIAWLTSVGVVGMALTLAARLDSFEGFSNFANLLALPLFFLSGAMYPIDSAPAWLRPFVYINPMTYAVDAMRQVAVGVGHHALSTDLLAIGAFAALTTLLATLTFRRA